jgi:transcriptional regulator with XRE-family HTH domain
MSKRMTTEEFIEYLKKQQGDQTQEEFAAEIGVSPAYLSDVYNNRKDAGDKITSALNVERSVVYTVKPLRRWR